MENFLTVLTAVADCITQKKSEEQIYLTLLQRGATLEQIKRALEQIKKESVQGEPAHSVKPIKKVASEESGEVTYKAAVRALLLVGALLLSAGVLFFAWSNWHRIPLNIKVINATVLMILCYATSWYLKENNLFPATARVLPYIGFVFYGAALYFAITLWSGVWPRGLDGVPLWFIFYQLFIVGGIIMGILFDRQKFFKLVCLLSIPVAFYVMGVREFSVIPLAVLIITLGALVCGAAFLRNTMEPSFKNRY